MSLQRTFTWSVTGRDVNVEHRGVSRKLLKTKKAIDRRFGGKSKLASFSLPQLRSAGGRVVCPYAGSCADVCFASQGSYYMPHVRAAYERNYQAIRKALNRDPFGAAAALLEDLHWIGGITHVRLHDSGDFYSKAYVTTWLQVARARPDITFYGYTKSIPLLPWGNLPDNLRLTQSLGGTRDHLVDLSRSHSRIFATAMERREAGYADGNSDDLPVIVGTTRIGLVYHGTKNLTEQMLVSLRTPTQQ